MLVEGLMDFLRQRIALDVFRKLDAGDDRSTIMNSSMSQSFSGLCELIGEPAAWSSITTPLLTSGPLNSFASTNTAATAPNASPHSQHLSIDGLNHENSLLNTPALLPGRENTFVNTPRGTDGGYSVFTWPFPLISTDDITSTFSEMHGRSALPGETHYRALEIGPMNCNDLAAGVSGGSWTSQSHANTSDRNLQGGAAPFSLSKSMHGAAKHQRVDSGIPSILDPGLQPADPNEHLGLCDMNNPTAGMLNLQLPPLLCHNLDPSLQSRDGSGIVDREEQRYTQAIGVNMIADPYKNVTSTTSLAGLNEALGVCRQDEFTARGNPPNMAQPKPYRRAGRSNDCNIEGPRDQGARKPSKAKKGNVRDVRGNGRRSRGKRSRAEHG